MSRGGKQETNQKCPEYGHRWCWTDEKRDQLIMTGKVIVDCRYCKNRFMVNKDAEVIG